MSSGNIVTVVLVLCALIVTAAVVLREFGGSGSRGALEARDIENWEELADGGHSLGGARSDSLSVTIVEFGDFQCPFCASVASTLKELRTEYGNGVGVLYRHFPLTSIHPHAMEAAVASECAGAQGRFEAFHDVLFEEQEAIGVVPWSEFARRAGVYSMDQFVICLSSDWARKRVREDVRVARKLRLVGTPSIIVNGRLLAGTPSLETLREAVDAVFANSSHDEV